MGEKTISLMELEAVLKTIPLFSELDQTTLTNLIHVGSHAAYPANQILYREGDTPDYLYVILAGEVRVYALDDTGNEVTLRLMTVGAFLVSWRYLTIGRAQPALSAPQPVNSLSLAGRRCWHCCKRRPAKPLRAFSRC